MQRISCIAPYIAIDVGVCHAQVYQKHRNQYDGTLFSYLSISVHSRLTDGVTGELVTPSSLVQSREQFLMMSVKNSM